MNSGQCFYSLESESEKSSKRLLAKSGKCYCSELVSLNVVASRNSSSNGRRLLPALSETSKLILNKQRGHDSSLSNEFKRLHIYI